VEDVVSGEKEHEMERAGETSWWRKLEGYIIRDGAMR